jgi:cytochrome c biogenesis protein CcmG/thiol:disulfide interchange protein DsbE
VPESRKAKRAERLEQRREERAQRKSGTPSKGPGRNVWLAAIAAAVIAVVAIGIFAFSSGDQETNTTASSGSETAASTSTSSDSDGNFPIIAYPQAIAELGPDQLEFTELLGTGKPVVLNFWAGQCPPCRAEMPAFQSVYDTYSDDFLLVGVDIGPFIGLGTRQSAIDLLAELEVTYPTAYSVDARAMQDFNVLGMPTTVFYDGDGVEVNRHTGLLTEQALEENVRDLVGA